MDQALPAIEGCLNAGFLVPARCGLLYRAAALQPRDHIILLPRVMKDLSEKDFPSLQGSVLGLVECVVAASQSIDQLFPAANDLHSRDFVVHRQKPPCQSS